MGPTASGKSGLAMELVQQLPVDIISVDSALVYRGMDIGTAKPTKVELATAPHRLIDICDPSESYSAGQFRDDALREIADIIAQRKIPLLVGGTMMYFNVLQNGVAQLPTADAKTREAIMLEANRLGWPALHEQLTQIDPVAANRIHPNDAQRIQRALEVFRMTGKPLTTLQQKNSQPLLPYNVVNIALLPEDRAVLHERIAQRFDAMLEQGFLDEVRQLHQQEGLHLDLPAMRTVGYRQAWMYLDGDYDFDTMRDKAIIATRQLAKRQYTWLRRWEGLTVFSQPDLMAVKDFLNSQKL